MLVAYMLMFGLSGRIGSPSISSHPFLHLEQSQAQVRLAFPRSSQAGAARDPVNGVPFSDFCNVDIRDRGEMYTRFSVHVPDRSYRAVASKAGTFLAALWGMANDRYGRLCARLREKSIDVWIMRTGEAGGELKQENLYVYNINSDRTGLEWARELAHEYGHYLLPGASGYTDPESWSNGVLGERLFLGWLLDDLRARKIDPDDLPFVKLEDLEKYCVKQTWPLIERVRTGGIDPRLIAKNDRMAMDTFTSLLLYADRTYGGVSIIEMLEYLPKDRIGAVGGIAFLGAFKAWLSTKRSFDTALPSNRTILVYFPVGEYSAVRIATNPANPGAQGATRLSVKLPGWKPVKFIDKATEVRLRWTRIAQKPASIGGNR